jgi:CHAT domain-containing protein
MTRDSSNDVIRELSRIETPQQLIHWQQQHPITSRDIDDAMAEVRRLVDSAAFEPAGRLAEWCVLLSRELADPLIKARATVTRGIVLTRINEDARALEYFDEALRLYQQAGDEVLAAKVRTNRVVAYSHLGRYEEALRDGEINNEVLARLGEKRLLARNYNNLGEVLFRLDRFQEWLSTLERAESLLQEIGDQDSLALVYLNHAVVLTSLNRSSEALNYYRRSKELAVKAGQAYIAMVCNYNLGYLHYIQGEYTTALDILNETRQALPTEQWYVPLCDLTQSEIYLEMNMYREAARLAQSAYTAFESTEKPFEMAKAVGVMAIARSQLREFKEAERLFERAKSMFQAQGNHVRAAGMDLYRGLMWMQLGRYAEAKAVAQHAYECFAKEAVKPKAAFARIVSARANLKLADLETASQDAAAATAIHQESPLPWVGHQLHAILGEIHFAHEDPENARLEFRKAINELERVRANIAPDELRLNYLKDKVPVYEMLLHTDLRLGDPASLREAFETAERAKSRTLVDLLAGSVDALRQVTSSSVDDIQAALPADAALVEYFMRGNDVMAFCLSRTGFEVVQKICQRDALRTRYDYLQYHLSRLTTDPAALTRLEMAVLNIQDHLAELYRMLVSPLEIFLWGAKTLVLVPFDFLHYLPFHALFDGSQYLTDRFTISYAPTATIFRLFNAREVDVHGPALLVGVPDAAAPFIMDEINSILPVLPNARTFVGAFATRDRITHEMTTARLIHIASHATFRPDNPMFSSIQLHDSSLNFFDIYNLRTSASLITLSGCGTGLSSVVAGDELLGLVRGFLYAGATSVVISLWDVNDQTTAALMKHFYSHLAAGHSKSQSLRLAMSTLREEHPHPYHWAPFLLMGNPT